MSRSKQTTYYSLQSFFAYFRLYKGRFAITLLCFIVANTLLAIIPVFIGKLVGALASSPVRGHSAIIYMWILFACSTGHDFTWQVSEFLYRKLLLPLSYTYEKMLFSKVIRMPYPYFVDKFTGKISSYIATITQEQREFIARICENYTSSIIGLVAVTIILSSLNWRTGVIFLVGLLCMFLVGRHTVRNSVHYEKRATDVQSTKNGKIIDIVANFVNVKSFHTELKEITAIGQEEVKSLTAASRSYFWGIIFWMSLGFFVRNFIWPLTIGLNVYLFLHHEVSIGQLATLLSTILIFSSTVWEIIWYVSQFNLQIARVEEAHTYLFGPHKLELNENIGEDSRPQAPVFQQQLELRQLTFAYPDKSDTDVLKQIDLQLKKGEKLGIVGRSGSGKTTITKLLLGYYPSDDGTLLLDDAAIDSRRLAQLISYVPQDTSLFHRTIAENIAYAADKSVSREDIIAAAKKAHAHEFISTISDGYDALVGERGVKLSAGQRQRIAIARAFLDDKPILILDEATSALDSESEILVQKALEALWQDKTVIAIAHRLSTLRHMDRIVVLDKGKIIEQGSHEELLAQNGQYAEFWAHQSGGFIDE